MDAFLAGDPTNPQARFLKGIVLTERAQTDAAIEVFAQLAAEYPDLPEPHNNLAVLYASRGEYVRARDALLLAINTHPSYATAHENLGDIYAKMAGLAYDKALQLDRKNDSAKAKLALMTEMVSIDEKAGTGTTQVASAKTSAVVTEMAVEPLANEEAERVLRTIHDWAQAWSDQDVDRYLTFYASNFNPADGTNRSQWAAVRRVRLRKPGFIRIGIDTPKIELQANQRVRATFVQSYQSDSYGDRVRKTLLLAMKAGEWKIIGEATIE